MQHNILLCQQLRGYIKRRPVNPVFFIHPLHTALIEPVKRIIYQFVIHQVCMNCSRNSGFIPVSTPRLPEIPSFMQVLTNRLIAVNRKSRFNKAIQVLVFTFVFICLFVYGLHSILSPLSPVFQLSFLHSFR